MNLRIVTPAGEFMNEPVEFVEMTTSAGQIGVFPGHTPTIAALEVGPVTVLQNRRRYWWFTGGGTALIDSDHVVLMLIGIVSHLDDEVLEACCARARAMLGEGTDELALAAACERARHTLASQPKTTGFIPEFDLPRAQILAELLHHKHH